MGKKRIVVVRSTSMGRVSKTSRKLQRIERAGLVGTYDNGLGVAENSKKPSRSRGASHDCDIKKTTGGDGKVRLLGRPTENKFRLLQIAGFLRRRQGNKHGYVIGTRDK